MLRARSKNVYLYMAMALFLLISSVVLAGEEGGVPRNEGMREAEISSEIENDANAPTAENWWKAKQSGDTQKADYIQAIMEKEAAGFWRSPCYDDVPMNHPRLAPPYKDGSSHGSFKWGNDVTIAVGEVSSGISSDYDGSGNIYAVRCSTYLGTDNAYLRVYKSTDDGANWSWLCGFVASGGGASFSYPVILTGSSGDPDKLYIFYLRSSNNGEVRVARYNQSGGSEGFFNIKSDSDTITYFTACGNYGLGSRLMVAYQRNPMASATPDVYTIVSSDYGEAWGGQVYITTDGSHPDMAYGRNAHVYLVYEKTGGSDDEVTFGRSTNYCASGSWEYFESLTDDSWHDNYPKVAALHTTPEETPYVWVAYNHDYGGTGNIDLRYAYSSDGGNNWSKNHYLASTADYDEMACDLWVKRVSSYVYVNICYLAYKWVSPIVQYSDIYYAYTNKYDPTSWHSLADINYWSAATNSDGRKVCQGTYGSEGSDRGIVYVGKSIKVGNYNNLYFDNLSFVDVEEEAAEGEALAGFSLSDNYPNPFNPKTKIDYLVPRSCHVKLEIFNVLGQRVATLVDQPKQRGNHQVTWNGRDQRGVEVASGVYFYRLEAEDFTQSKRMVLMK
jgi:hypothetical protein